MNKGLKITLGIVFYPVSVYILIWKSKMHDALKIILTVLWTPLVCLLLLITWAIGAGIYEVASGNYVPPDDKSIPEVPAITTTVVTTSEPVTTVTTVPTTTAATTITTTTTTPVTTTVTTTEATTTTATTTEATTVTTTAAPETEPVTERIIHNPEPEPEKARPQGEVFIAASGKGKKYHYDPYCSNMKGEVIGMTKEEAEAQGYTMCGRE